MHYTDKAVVEKISKEEIDKFRKEMFFKQHIINKQKYSYCLNIEDIPNDSIWEFHSFTPSSLMLDNLVTPTHIRKLSTQLHSKNVCCLLVYKLITMSENMADYDYKMYIYPRYPVEIKGKYTTGELLNVEFTGFMTMVVSQ